MPARTTIKLSTVFTDTSLKKTRVDPVLPDAGALLLVDLAHPANPADFPAGVPASGTSLHNLAWKQAASMIGSGDATALAAKFYRDNFTGSNLIERTSKGGLHAITTKAVDPGSAMGARLHQASPGHATNTPLLKWIFDNPTHDIYVSTWGRTTRAATVNQTSLIHGIYGVPNSTTNYLQYAALGTGSAPFSGMDIPGLTTGAWFASQHAAAWSGTVTPSTTLAITTSHMKMGAVGIDSTFAFDAARRQGNGDRVVYRTYIEDLTVSGRSYATVRALDLARYTADVLTAGGRFYNDTYTNPTTIA